MREGDQRARAGPEKEGRPRPGTAPLLNKAEYSSQEKNRNGQPFRDHREAGRALIVSGKLQTVKSAQFCGGLTVQDAPLSPAQRDWLSKLLARAGLPSVAEVGHG